MEDPDTFEQRPAHRRMKLYLPAMIIAGLAAIVLVYATAMLGLGWKVPGFGGDDPGSTTSVRRDDAVTLYASPTTRAYFASVGGNYDVLLAAWRKYGSEHRKGLREADTVEAIGKLTGGVLVVPSAVALTAAERAAIESFRMRGGAVLLTWASGTRDEKNEWLGWTWMEQLTATRFSSEITKGDTSIGFLIVNGESPVAHTNPAGQRIWLGTNAESLLNFKAAGSRIAARFMNWARSTVPERRGEGAVFFTEVEGFGRTALFGFAETSWEYQPHLIYPLIDDALDWLQRRPAVLKAAWPHGRVAAQVVEMDTEQGFDNALRLAALMHDIRYRGTYYILTSVAVDYPGVLKTLARDHEIAYHGDIHISFKDQAAAEQKKRIETMQAQMRSVLPDISGFTGFRAPTEGYDATTEKLLHTAGIRHHLADPNATEARLPFLAKIDGTTAENGLVILPRTQRDDINLLRELLDVDGMRAALVEDFDLSRDQGALGILSVHTQNFDTEMVLTKAFPAYLAHLKKYRDSIWLVSAGEVADWWRERERFKVSARDLDSRIELAVSVQGSKPLAGASLIVTLPKKDLLPSVRGAKSGMPEPNVRALDPWRAAVVFDKLEAGDYLYQVTF